MGIRAQGRTTLQVIVSDIFMPMGGPSASLIGAAVVASMFLETVQAPLVFSRVSFYRYRDPPPCSSTAALLRWSHVTCSLVVGKRVTTAQT